MLSEDGVATAVPLHSVVEAGLSQRVLFQEDGQPVILEVLDQEPETPPAAEVSGRRRRQLRSVGDTIDS